MVGHRKGEVRAGDRDAARGDLAESVVRALVDEVPVDPQERQPVVALGHHMRVPQLVEQRPGGGHDGCPISHA